MGQLAELSTYLNRETHEMGPRLEFRRLMKELLAGQEEREAVTEPPLFPDPKWKGKNYAIAERIPKGYVLIVGNTERGQKFTLEGKNFRVEELRPLGQYESTEYTIEWALRILKRLAWATSADPEEKRNFRAMRTIEDQKSYSSLPSPICKDLICGKAFPAIPEMLP